jgi:hypothetical protein
MEFDVPDEFKGKTATIRTELLCNTGNWKSGWSFEGYTIAFNASDKFE